jgi:hypothetical protein
MTAVLEPRLAAGEETNGESGVNEDGADQAGPIATGLSRLSEWAGAAAGERPDAQCSGRFDDDEDDTDFFDDEDLDDLDDEDDINDDDVDDDDDIEDDDEINDDDDLDEDMEEDDL